VLRYARTLPFTVIFVFVCLLVTELSLYRSNHLDALTWNVLHRPGQVTHTFAVLEDPLTVQWTEQNHEILSWQWQAGTCLMSQYLTISDVFSSWRCNKVREEAFVLLPPQKFARQRHRCWSQVVKVYLHNLYPRGMLFIPSFNRTRRASDNNV
jgi:hypothetical protein